MPIDRKTDKERNDMRTLSSSSSSSSNTQIPQYSADMDHLVALLDQRAQGYASNEQVESAVDKILHVMGAPTQTSQSAKSSGIGVGGSSNNPSSTNNLNPTIQTDMGNYDDDSDEGAPSNVALAHGVTRKLDSLDSTGIHELEGKKECTKKQKRNGDESEEDIKIPQLSEVEYHETISHIPMGREASKMMTTFGDGPRPDPEALELALLGTRQTLQIAIMDARKIRRRLQQDFQNAKVSIDPKFLKAARDKKARQNKHLIQSSENGSPKEYPASAQKLLKNSHAEAADPQMVYRALADGWDRLAVDHKCGFHMEELTHLFPEEMRAYQRWTEMHEAFNNEKDNGRKEKLKAKVGDKELEEEEQEEGEEDDQDSTSSLTPSNQLETDGGHLKERSAHFDYRTNRMKKDWYLEYARVRQGSFLPSIMRVKRTQAEKDWDSVRKKKGRMETGSWELMSGRSVRFLHWLGFDPPNLFPPDEEVTHALAFLAYDRLGRIVEKAVYLRNLETAQEEDFNKGHAITGQMWEIPEGEQLSKEDVERALEDPDIKPATVYGSGEATGHTSIQLYFGPGWEDRLELEMEEFLAATQGSDAGPQVSPEEKAFRQQEASILNQISKAPVIGEEGLQRLVQIKKAQRQGET